MQSADAPVSKCTSLHARDCVRLGPNLVYPFITALARPALHEFLSFVRVCFSAVLVAWTAVVLRVRPSVRLLVAASVCYLSASTARLGEDAPCGYCPSVLVGFVPGCVCLGFSLCLLSVLVRACLSVSVTSWPCACCLSVYLCVS